MRRASKVDENQREIVSALRSAGATVQLLHAVGQGCPDLLVGFRQKNLLIEVKDGLKPPSARKLTVDQVEWHGGWKGQVCVVDSVESALLAITENTNG
jgi:Holliday junction resolvase